MLKVYLLPRGLGGEGNRRHLHLDDYGCRTSSSSSEVTRSPPSGSGLYGLRKTESCGCGEEKNNFPPNVLNFPGQTNDQICTRQINRKK